MEITVQEILAQLVRQLEPQSETASLDAQVLVANIVDQPHTWILAHPEFPLNNSQHQKIIRAANRLKDGEPLPYVIGHWEFYGLDFYLNPHVLIPRPETELLVEQAINWLRLHPNHRKGVDVGTGSGCIGISLAKNIQDLQMLLTDISNKALDVARINAKKYKLSSSLEFLQADLLDGVSGPFNLICANLPYIPSSRLAKLPVADKEPKNALDGGDQGMELISKLLEQASRQLISGGLMLLEIDSSQGIAINKLIISSYPASKVRILKDLAGKDRCLEIERPNFIVHLCQREAWLKAQEKGIYESMSMINDGFIHCSQPEQILEVANRFYRGVPEILQLWIDPDKLTSEIRWENVVDALFPHIYGPINLSAVLSVTRLQPNSAGVYHTLQLPDLT